MADWKGDDDDIKGRSEFEKFKEAQKALRGPKEKNIVEQIGDWIGSFEKANKKKVKARKAAIKKIKNRKARASTYRAV